MKREARRALKRHLANVVYRRLYAWAKSRSQRNERYAFATALGQLVPPRGSGTFA